MSYKDTEEREKKQFFKIGARVFTFSERFLFLVHCVFELHVRNFTTTIFILMDLKRL